MGAGTTADATATQRRLRLVVVALVISLFAVPAAVLLLGPKPARFGFQMYSGYGVPSAWWIDGEGHRHEVDLAEIVATTRPDVAWTRILPPELCDRFPQAVSVEVQQVRPGQPEQVSQSC